MNTTDSDTAKEIELLEKRLDRVRAIATNYDNLTEPSITYTDLCRTIHELNALHSQLCQRWQQETGKQWLRTNSIKRA